MSSKMTKRNKRLAVIAALAVVAGGAGLASWWRSDHLASRADEEIAFVGTPLRAGDVHRYQLELHSALGAAGGIVIDYRLRGTWTTTVLRASRDGATLRAVVSDAELLADGRAVDPKLTAKLGQAKRDFASPLTYRIGPDGTLGGVVDSADVELQVRSMMRAIAAATQVVRAESSDETWEVSERDGTGTYRVRYTALDATHLSKTKLRYTELSQQATPALSGGGSLSVDKSDTKLTLRDDGFLLELASQETLRASGATLGGVSSTTELTLRFLGTERAPPAQLAALASVADPNASPNVYAQEGSYSVEADRARIGGRRLEDFMGDLNSLPLDEKSRSDADRTKQRHAFIGLAALSRRDPEAVKQIVDLIKSGSPLSSFLWDVLGSAGSPEAQAALCELIDMPRWNEEERLAQMIDLSMVEKPTPATVDFLRGKLDDPEQHTQARYGLGTAAHNLKSAEPERATEIVAELNKQIVKAQGQSRVEYIKALGNSGHADGMPQVMVQLASPDPQVRISALDALRFMEDPEANTRIVRALRSDEDDDVRFAAAAVAEWRPPDDELLQALVIAWKRDASDDVRKGAHATIARLDGKFPGLMAKLESAYASL